MRNLLLALLFLVAGTAQAQIVPAQNQVTTGPYGGIVLSTSSSPTAKLNQILGATFGDLLYWTGSRWNTIATSSLGLTGTTYTFTYPLQNVANVISLAFGTTTANTWSQIQTFTLSPVFSTLSGGTVNSRADGTVYSTSTSTPTVTAPIAYSGTLGSFIGGVSGTFSCIAATGSVAGCLSAADWTSFNNKVSSTSLSAVSPIRYVSSTGVFSWLGLATTSQPASSNLLVSNGGTGVYGVATTSVTCSGAASCTPFTAIGSAPITISASGSGSGLATTSPVTGGNVLVYSQAGSGSATGAATTTLTITGPFNVPSTQGYLVGGTNSSIGYYGLATTSQPTSSQILTSNGGAGVYGTATSTLTASSPLTGSFTQVGAGGALGCQTASGSQAGCLSSADWTSFNNKVGSTSLSATYPVTYNSSTGVLALAFGTTTSNTWANTQTFTNSPVFSTLGAGTVNSTAVGTIYNTATSTVSTGLGLSYSGTMGSEIGGVSGTLTVATSSLYTGTTGQFPYFSNTNTITATSTVFLAATGNIGLGITSPGAKFVVSQQGTVQTPISGSTAQFVGLDGAPLRVTFDTHNNANTSGTAFMFRRSRGTAASPTAVQGDDVLGSLNFRGYGATAYAAGSTALMTAKATGIFTDTSMPTAITFDTTATTSVTALERVRIDSTGNLGVGTTSPYAKLSVHANAGETNRTLFSIGSSTAAATTTLFSVLNNGVINSTAGATSTFSNTIQSPCFSTNGTTCLTSGSGGSGVGTISTSTTEGATQIPFATSNAAYPALLGFQSGFNYFSTTSQLTIPSNGWYSLGNQLLAYSSSTNQSAIFGIGAGGQNATTSATQGKTTAVGYFALNALTTGIRNTAVGEEAQASTTSSSDNTGLGYNAFWHHTGAQNTAVGSNAMGGTGSGSQNVAIGYNTLAGAAMSGSTNVAIGYQTMTSNTSGGSNLALGASALTSNTTGGFNVAIGTESMNANVGAGSNAAIGYRTLFKNTAGQFNAAIGNSALLNSQGDSNVAIGSSAGQGGSFYTSTGNVSIGLNTGLAYATSSNYNTLIGYDTGFAVTSGYENTIVGSDPPTSRSNTTTGGGNVGLGTRIIFPTASTNNYMNLGRLIFAYLPATTTASTLATPATGMVGIGTTTPDGATLTVATTTAKALRITNGSATALQWVMGEQIDGTLSWATSTAATPFATGTQSAMTLNGAAGSTGISVGSTTPWRTNVFVGTMAITGLTASGAGGALCVNTTSFEVLYSSLGTCTPSSRRYKHDIEDLKPGTALSTIEQLKPVSFVYNKDRSLGDQVHYGLIAEQVAEVDTNLVGYVDDNGNLAGPETGHAETLHFEEFNGLFVQAIQDQQKQIEALKHGTFKTVQDNYQWFVIGLLVLWNLYLTFRRKHAV